MFENNKLPFILGIATILGAVIVVSCLNAYKSKMFGITYNSTVSKMQDAITAMETSGHDYFRSPLYSDVKLDDYSVKPAKFLSDTIGIKEDCGNSNGKCFASKYKDENSKIYNPKFEGACALLKNGISICMMPQIKHNDIYGIMDVNGKDSPNILGKDLRTFTIKAKVRNYEPEDDEETGSVNYIGQP